jgi:hypothetical protein
MDKEDNDKNMIFKYLNELFKNINIEEIEFPEFNISMIPVATGKMITAIEGRVGNSPVFTYYPNIRTISFDRREYITMLRIFGFDGKKELDYIKSYFIKNVGGIPDDVNIYIT